MRVFRVTPSARLCSCRVLERIGARALVAHVRTFADFLVYEFSTSAGGQQLNKCIEILNDMVWKYNIVTLDRLILCLVPIFFLFYFFVRISGINLNVKKHTHNICPERLIKPWN